MKKRSGFVSNSSSSSFIVVLAAVSDNQVELIKNHATEAEEFGMDCFGDAWNIEIKKYCIKGYTIMDNFDMCEYLGKIGVNMDEVEWGEY